MRVIETQSVQRIGGRENIEINVRIISASHKDLEEMTNKGSFRADLMYRLNVFPIIVPSLKQRTDDLRN